MCARDETQGTVHARQVLYLGPFSFPFRIGMFIIFFHHYMSGGKEGNMGEKELVYNSQVSRSEEPHLFPSLMQIQRHWILRLMLYSGNLGRGQVHFVCGRVVNFCSQRKDCLKRLPPSILPCVGSHSFHQEAESVSLPLALGWPHDLL
jgi:hypothetical protein